MGAAKHARLTVRRMGARLQGRRGAVFLVAGGTLLALAIIAVTGLAAWSAHSRVIADAGREIHNLTIVIAKHTDRAFQAVDVSLDTVVEGARGSGALTDFEAFAGWASSLGAHQAMRGRVGPLPQLDAVAILSRDGRLLGNSRAWPPMARDVANPDHLEEFRTSTVGTHVGSPRRSADGTWVIPVARRIARPDGEMLGIAVGVVRMAYFERTFAEASLPAGSTVTLLRNDGALLARTPPMIESLGSNLRARIRAVHGPMPDIAYWQDGRPIRAIGLDGLEWLCAGQALPSVPVQLRIGVPMDNLVAAWREISARTILGAILLLLVLAWAVLAALRLFEAEARSAQERLRLQREIALRHDDFRTTVEGMSQGVCKFGADGRLSLTNSRCEAVIGLQAQIMRPGITLQELTRLAEATGAKGALEVTRRLGRLVESRETASFLHDMPDGRIASVLHRPMADGSPPSRM